MKVMQKVLYLIIICMATLCLCSCYKEPSVPSDGVWYCDDLSVVIDFRLWQQGESIRCAIRYTTADKLYYEPVYANVNFNSNFMIIEPIDVNSDAIASGECDYTDGSFKIHDFDSDKVYTFVKMSYSSIEDVTAKSEMI